MTVYVDDAKHPYRGMKMCHMVADSQGELLDMAVAIGFTEEQAWRWLQHPGTEREHFDICQSKKALAVKAGAVSITQRELGHRLLAKRSVATLEREPLPLGAAEKEDAP
jgi:hypothetical protein